MNYDMTEGEIGGKACGLFKRLGGTDAEWVSESRIRDAWTGAVFDLIRSLAAVSPAQRDTVEINFEFETLSPLQGLERIDKEYSRTHGRLPDAFMAQVVAQAKEDLFMWWGAHREKILAALEGPKS